MRSLTIFLVMILTVATIAGPASYVPADQSQRTVTAKPLNPEPRRDPVEIFFEEDFEDADQVAENWTTANYYGDIAWHKTDLLGEEDDLAWWCGDSLTQYNDTTFGYDNRWLQFLDTPVLDLTDAGEGLAFTFTGYWILEDPRLIPPGAPYDGWDGWFVQISTNGGEEFVTLIPAEVDYTAERVSAAERLWGYENQPGWVAHSGEWAWGDDDTTHAERPDAQWRDVAFDLSEFAGEDNVVIRFVLTSDNTVAAPLNIYLADRSGIWIDDILITDADERVFLSNNADDDPVPSDLIPRVSESYGGDHWVRTDSDAHSGDWSMQNDDNYFFMNNGLISPPFELTEGFNSWLELWIYCDLPDWEGANNALEDYYACWVTDDEGETWTRIYYDYARDGVGGDGWVQYTPDMLFNGTLDLSEYAGSTIQIQYIFLSDNDHDGGNGSGLFIDDIKVMGSNLQPFEASMENLHVPYPLTAGYRTPGITVEAHNNGLRDLDNISAYWGIESINDYHRYPIVPRPNILSDTLALVQLSDYIIRPVPGWTPVIADNYTIWTYLSVEEDTTSANDSTAIENLTVWPAGLYEFGYDNRTYQYTFEYEPGSGAAVRFSPDRESFQNYSIAAVKFMFNGEQDEDANFTLHIRRAGEDETSIGAEDLLSIEVTVPPDSLMPNTMTVDLYEYEELRGLGRYDFWVWVEVQRDDSWPEIIGDDEFDPEATHNFTYDGEQLVASDRDFMIQAILVTTADVVADLVPQTDGIDFGVLSDGEIEVRTISIWASGLEEVTITDIRSSEDMFLVGWNDDVTLKPGQAVTIDLVYEPYEGGTHFADLIIESNDETPPEILLRGEYVLNVNEEDYSPIEFGLGNPYPNPFNSTSKINFALEAAGNATLVLYDLSGREVMQISNGSFTAGNHSVMLQADALSAGMYILRLEAGVQTDSRKIVLVK